MPPAAVCAGLDPLSAPSLTERIETAIKYEGYLTRQAERSRALPRWKRHRLPKTPTDHSQPRAYRVRSSRN